LISEFVIVTNNEVCLNNEKYQNFLVSLKRRDSKENIHVTDQSANINYSTILRELKKLFKEKDLKKENKDNEDNIKVSLGSEFFLAQIC